VANVSVAVPGTGVGTVTNADGTFSIKIKYGLDARLLEFSHLGYNLRLESVDGTDTTDLAITLTPGAIEIAEVTVEGADARSLVEEAARRIGDNYNDRASMLTGFYRETIQKRSNYVDIAEAVIEIFYPSYVGNSGVERLRLIKGRRVVSPRIADTLGIRLQGGANVYIRGDIVRNRDLLLEYKELDNYRFRLGSPVTIDDRPHYTVLFEPARVYSEWVLFTGRLYIDRRSLTISRAEYSLDMSSREKVTAMILSRKPASLRFTPQEVSYVLSYRQRDGRSYLYYTSSRLRFRCDWRRRMFATAYTVSSEMVVTDSRTEGVEQIPLRESLRENQSLVDRVDDFYGPEFWEDYNIIAPTESLENAVDRLKRRLE
jgi:hypothetical protein